MLGGLFGVGTVVKQFGEAATSVWGTIKGDQRQIEAGNQARETATHQEQMAVLAQFATEFAGRPPKTWWDSFVDGLNRLPRPVITFSIIGIFVFAFYDPMQFVTYMQALQVVPDELWLMWLTILAFWFGGRIISHDIRKPRITPEQIQLAKEIIAGRTPAIEPAPDVALPAPPVVTVPDALPTVPPSLGEPAVDAMIADLIRREGGYVDHPADRGGPTNYGITQSTLADWRNAPVTASDVRALSNAEAAKIYRDRFYLAPGINHLPASLQPHVFDIAVNSGPGQAARLLQRALNILGAGIAEDGRIGPKTLAACRGMNSRAVNNALVGVRLEFYERLVAARPNQAAFINGWRARAKIFLA